MSNNIKRGLGKSFDKIFGEGKVQSVPNQIPDFIGANTEKIERIERPNVVEKIVEVPVEKVVEKIVEVPVEKVVEKIVEVEKNSDSSGKPLMVNINFVQANKNQPRKQFDEEKLKELAESIENYGIIEPLIVKKQGPIHYEIIAGERRLRAAKIAKLTEVPVIVKDYDEREKKEIALIENVQREDLNTIEKALGYKALIDEYNLTQEALAVKLGISRSAIANTLRILSLDNEIIEMIKEGKLSEGHAKVLLSIDDENFRAKVAKKVISESLSVRKIEDMIRLEKLANYRKEKDAKLNTEEFKRLKIQLKDLEKQMKNRLSANVKINAKSEKAGTIEIKYDNLDELDRIYMLINTIIE